MDQNGFVIYNVDRKEFLSNRSSWAFSEKFSNAVVYKTEQHAKRRKVRRKKATDDNGYCVIVPVEICLNEKDLFASIMAGRGN